jgi:hypothetical protein
MPNPFDDTPFAPNVVSHYAIVDCQTGEVVATAKTRAGATRAVDRRDNNYGAVRYQARPVYAVAS